MTAPEAATGWYRPTRARFGRGGGGGGTAARSAVGSAAGWAGLSLGMFLLGWWAAAVWTERTSPGLVPGPAEVAETFWDLSVHQFAGLTLPGHVFSSLTRWGTGFAWAVGLGVPLGLIPGTSGTIRAAVTPIFEFLRYIPPFAWIPLAVLWLGAGHGSAALIVFIAAFPPVVISTQVGVAGVEPTLLRASRMLGSGWLRTTAEVIAPVSLPATFTGIRIAVSNGWMALIAAELISGTEGVGFLIIQGQENNNVAIVMAGMVAIGLTGAVITGVVELAGRRLTRWRKTSGSNA